MIKQILITTSLIVGLTLSAHTAQAAKVDRCAKTGHAAVVLLSLYISGGVPKAEYLVALKQQFASLSFVPINTKSTTPQDKHKKIQSIKAKMDASIYQTTFNILFKYHMLDNMLKSLPDLTPQKAGSIVYQFCLKHS